MASRVVVDTSIWSLFFRRQRGDLSAPQRRTVLLLRDLIVEGRAVLLGVVRQELLSGVGDPATFDLLRTRLATLDDVPPDADDYERAAMFANRCRSHGVANSPTDMLIASFAVGRDLPILTIDDDFKMYQEYLRLIRHPLFR